MLILLLDDAPHATPLDALRRALEPARLARLDDATDPEPAALLLVPSPDDPATVARRVAAARAGWPDLPLVVWIPGLDVPAVVAAMRAGADDVVAGPVEPVGPAMRAAVPRGTSRKLPTAPRLAVDEPFRSMPTPLYRSRRDGVLVDGNPALAALLGIGDPESLPGTDVRSMYVDPAARTAWTERLEREGVVRGFEAQLVRPDGRRVWVRETAHVVEAASEARYEGSLEDITARVEAQADLEQSRRRLATLLANLPGVAYRCRNDPRRTLELVSDGVRELVGLDANELSEEPFGGWTSLVHPDDRAAVAEQIAAAVDGERPFQLQYRVITASGGERWVAETGRAVDADHLEGFVTDVSDRWEAEQRVRDSEVWYRTLFENAADGILLTDAEGRVIDGNPAATAILGAPLDALLGRTLPELDLDRRGSGEDPSERLAEAVASALRGHAEPAEIPFRRGDGATVEVAVELARVHVGGRWFLQAILHDVTERRAAAAAVARRDAMLAAVSFAAARFLHAPEWGRLAGEVLAQLGGAAGARRAALYERRPGPDGTAVELRHSWRAGDAPLPAPASLHPRDAGLGRWADTLAAGQPLVGSTGELPPAEQETLRSLGVESFVAVPVLCGSEVWGVLVLDDARAGRRWTDGEVEAVRAAADILGGAVWLDRARQAVAARTEALELLNRVTGLLASRADAVEVMQEIADLIRAHCALDHVSFALPTAAGRRLEFAAWSGADAATRSAGIDPDGPGMIAEAARHRRPVYAADVGRHEGYLPGDAEIRSEYAVPMIDADELLGVLNAESRRVDGIGPWQRDLIDRLAVQAAVAVRRRPGD